MKTAIKQTKMITMGIMSFLIIGATEATFANPVQQDPVELKTISNLNKQPIFQLKMNNTEAGEYLVRVKDGNGDILYSETLKGKNVSRKYKLDINQDEIFESLHVRFEITSIKTHETFTYNVTRSNREVEEIIVAKL